MIFLDLVLQIANFKRCFKENFQILQKTTINERQPLTDVSVTQSHSHKHFKMLT